VTPEEKKNRICRYIVSRYEAFRTVESDEFRAVSGVVMTGEEVRKRIIAMKNDIFLKMKNLLESSSCITISFDEWSDALHFKYLGIRAYSVCDRQYWNLCLEHIKLQPHQTTAHELSLLIARVLRDKYEIRDKVFFAVTDNASVMEATVREIGLIRLPCFCHVLNLLLHDVLDEVKISPLLAFVGSVANSDRFTNFLIDSNAKYSSIPSYSETRWFSLWKTIRNCLEDRYAIEAFINQEKKHHRQTVVIPQGVWETAEKLKGVLQTFKNACCLLESDKFGSISHAFQGLKLVQECLTNNGNKDDRFEAVWKKCLTHWNKFVTSEVRVIVAIAMILNPSVSLKLLTDKEIEAAVTKMGVEIAGVNIATTAKITKKKEMREDDAGLTLSDIEEEGSENTGEINQLLSMDRTAVRRCQGEFNLWQWWEGNRAVYPALYDVAMKYLALPASSAAAERQFSKAKLIQGNRRLSLATNCFQALVYVAENMHVLKGRKRNS
jgi:hypothetical protein